MTTTNKTFSVKNGLDVANTVVLDSSRNLSNVASINANTVYSRSGVNVTAQAADAYAQANTVANAGATNQVLYRNSSNVITGSDGLRYDGSALKLNGRLESLVQAGDEGGELYLNKPVSNTTIVDGIVIDVYQNKIRFFEAGGNNRGAFIDFTAANTGVGSNLLAGVVS